MPVASRLEHDSCSRRSAALQRQTESKEWVCTFGRFRNAGLLDDFRQLDQDCEHPRS